MSHLPTVTVEVAFATNPLATPTWTDISSYVRSLSVNRGRQHELDRFEAGTASLVLDNGDRRFEPEYAAGAYYPNVKPMKRLRITATYDSTTFDVFEGFIERWPLTYPGVGKDATVDITAVDALVYLSILKFPSYPQLVQDDGADAFYRLGDGPTTWADVTGSYADGTTTGDVTSGSGLIPAAVDDGGASFPGGVAGGDYITIGTAPFDSTDNFAIEAVVQTTFVTGSEGVAFFWHRTNSGSAGIPGVQCNVLGDGTEGHVSVITRDTTGTETTLTGSVNVSDGEPHHVAVVRTGGTLYIYVDGVLDTSAANTVNIDTPAYQTYIGRARGGSYTDWAGTIDEVAFYTTAPSSDQIVAHARAAGTRTRPAETAGARIGAVLDEIGWPAGERDLDTGSRTVQAYVLTVQTPRDHIEDVANTDQGLFYVGADGDMTFIDRTALAAQSSQASWGDADGGVYNDRNYNDGHYGGNSYRYEDIVFSYDIDRIRNDVRVAVRDGGTQVATDSTSITTYGGRTYTVDTHHNTPADALSDAETFITNYKDPQIRVESIVINPARQGNWAAVLGRELGDVITVTRQPPGGGDAISQEVRIGAITHAASPQAGWRTTWQLEPT